MCFYMDQEMEIGKELDIKSKIAKDILEKIYTKLFKEYGIAIITFIYFIFLNFVYSKLQEDVFTIILHAFAGLFLVGTIILCEIAYRKDNDEIWVHSVELLVLSIITLFIPYVYFRRGIVFKALYSFCCLYFAIYYSIKALIIYNSEIRKFKASLSDVKEITVDENESYLDEKNERKFEDVQDTYDRNVVSIVRKRDKIKMKLENFRHAKSDSKQNKRELVLEKVDGKIEKKEESIEEIKQAKKARRGRPKKKTVKSMATASRNKKKDGDSNDD